ncbi:MAG: class I mannose-6-phosphate isomerase [Gemmatimonadetes bacterium]|nr:class I mannose-6-phosphate isomerase [Gemmatimonadota bacterium]
MGLDAPLSFSPRFQHYIWGGRHLESVLGRRIPDGDVAESWEISAHRAAVTPVRGGEFDGMPLDELHARYGDALVGRRGRWATERGVFPLLVKLLDANRPLSVQVHPDDAYARAHEGDAELGKTEMWYVLWAREGAEIVFGLKPGTTRESLETAVRAGRVEDCLRRVPAKAGDAFLIEAGTVHAILDGILIAEVQQSSNTTYRVHDWGRVGADGRPRDLHIRQALDVIDFRAGQEAPSVPQKLETEKGTAVRRETVSSSDKFVVERVVIPAGEGFRGTLDGETMEIWGVLTGVAAVKGEGGEVDLSGVAFGLLPATMGPFEISAQSEVEALRVYLPDAG